MSRRKDPALFGPFRHLFGFHGPVDRTGADGLSQVLEQREKLARIGEREQALIRMLREQLLTDVMCDQIEDLTRRLEAIERHLGAVDDKPGNGSTVVSIGRADDRAEGRTR